MKLNALTLLFVLFSVSAIASSKKPKLETYSATTDEGSEIEGSRTLALPPISYSPPAPHRVQAAASPAKPALMATFDTVPADQAESISRRLALVEVLIRKYGRAYDYRSHTLHELQSILEQLDNAVATSASMSAIPSTEVQNP